MTFHNLSKTIPINTINYFFKAIDLYLEVLFASPSLLCSANKQGIKLFPPCAQEDGEIIFFSPGGFFFFNYYHDVDYDWNQTNS